MSDLGDWDITAPIPDDSIVIRGSWIGDPNWLQRAWVNAASCFAKIGVYGLCAASRPNVDAHWLATNWTYSGKVYQATTAGRIRALGDGFDVIPDDRPGPHAVIILAGELAEDWSTDSGLLLVKSVFGSTKIANPNYVPRGRTDDQDL